MKSGLISAGLLMIGLAACQNTAPPAETAQIEDPLALEQFAIAQIYETFHPFDIKSYTSDPGPDQLSSMKRPADR
ncbi:MAG: hypothetical protein AAFY82_06005, partial [Pseudomonadota bacterium]